MRRLGVGGAGGGGGGDRPLRAQLVIALVIGLVLLAVPLYLWRRPSGNENAAADAGLRHGAGRDGGPSSHAEVTDLEAGSVDDGVKLAPVQRVKCSASARSKGQRGNLCDRLPFFEDALTKAIHSTRGCAPRTGKAGTLNYVLAIDFQHRRVGSFPGASGQWKGPQARRATQCVLKSLPAPPWDSIRHQYRYYMLAVLATYPAPGALPGPAGAPIFSPHH